MAQNPNTAPNAPDRKSEFSPATIVASPERALKTVRGILERGITNDANNPRIRKEDTPRDVRVIESALKVNYGLSETQAKARLVAAYDLAGACLAGEPQNRRGLVKALLPRSKQSGELSKYYRALQVALGRPDSQGKINRGPRLPGDTRAVTLGSTTEDRLRVLGQILEAGEAKSMDSEGPHGDRDLVGEIISFYESLTGSAASQPTETALPGQGPPTGVVSEGAPVAVQEVRSPGPIVVGTEVGGTETRGSGIVTNEQVDGLGGEETIQVLSESLKWPVEIDPYAPEFVRGLRELINRVPALMSSTRSNEYSFLVVKQDGILMEFDFDEQTRIVKLGAIYIPDSGDVDTYHNTSTISDVGSERIHASKRINNQGERQLSESHVHPMGFFNKQKGVAWFSGGPDTPITVDADYGAMKRDQRNWFKTGKGRLSMGDKAEFMDRIAHLAERGNMVVNLPTADRPTLLFTTMYHTAIGVQINEYIFDPRISDPRQAITLVDAYGQDTPDSYIMPTNQMLEHYQQLAT